MNFNFLEQKITEILNFTTDNWTKNPDNWKLQGTFWVWTTGFFGEKAEREESERVREFEKAKDEPREAGDVKKTIAQ